MPKDFISVDRSSRYGDQLLNLKTNLRAVANTANYLRDVSLHMIADPDYTDVDTQFGVGTGNGQVTYNVLNSVVSQLNHADVQTLIERFG